MGSEVVECIVRGPALLGECPLWSESEQVLYWIDIDGRAIHRFDPADGRDELRHLPGRPGSIALTVEPGRLLMATEHRLAIVDWQTGTVEPWLDLEPAETGNRLNDGRCDRMGRFWVGSMFDPSSAGRSTGMLHRVDSEGTATTVRTGIGVANGLAFSPNGQTMYFADTHRETVWAYDYDGASGEATNERLFLDFGRPDLPGRPDGGCVDAEGHYWIACVYGWAVLRVSPEGEVVRRIEMPVEKPTMPAFGGPAMTTLFVTSIGLGGSRPLAPGQPDAGGLFAIATDVTGIAETPFGGPTARTTR
jgi:sugar lactone lactonase YvrE